ncbi:MAG: hypothetical protein K5745_04970 [Saccharofermentans sp.]|nr:hypothetical protein [Saccharofermentans sp.]
MNKYNEYMSHITVDEEMKERVLKNVMEHAGKAPTPIKKKAKISTLQIISCAVAGVLVVGFAVFIMVNLAGSMGMKSSKSVEPDAHNAEVYTDGMAETTIAEAPEAAEAAAEEAAEPEMEYFNGGDSRTTTGEADSCELEGVTVFTSDNTVEEILALYKYTRPVDICGVKVYLLSTDEEDMFTGACWQIGDTVYSASNKEAMPSEEWESSLISLIELMV